MKHARGGKGCGREGEGAERGAVLPSEREEAQTELGRACKKTAAAWNLSPRTRDDENSRHEEQEDAGDEAANLLRAVAESEARIMIRKKL